MNLVKAQALANDLPIPELQKYANGFDPRIIPPWIATGTLQAKTDIKKRMENMMGGTQGETPSVKEQIEQKAGLMAAQAMQQQQAQQQMAQRPQPGPTPENIPQPEAQPRQTLMARGGLASVPTRFAFKPGGIVGYAGGGDTMGMPSLQEQDLASQAAELAAKERSKASIAEKIAELEKKANELEYSAPEMAGAVRAQISALISASKPAAQAAAPTRTDVQRGGAAAPPAPRAKPPLPTQVASRPQQMPQEAPTGLPAAMQRSPYFAQAESSVNAPIKAPTTQDIIAEQTALSPAAMQEAAMQKRNEERRARADKEMSAFNASKPSGLDDMIRILGQSAQYKGGTGLAPAYTANQQEKRAAEAAALKRQNEMYNAADTQEYEGAKDLYGARAGAFKQANQSYQDRLKSRSEVLAQLAGVDQRRMDEQINRLTQFELQRLRAAESARGTPDQQLFAQFLKLKADGKTKEAQNLLDSLDAFKGAGRNQEDTMAKQLAKAKVEIASSMTPQKMKDEQLAGIAALERQLGIGGSGGGTPLPANASAANLTVGTVYQTARGPAKWTGTGFAPV